jgi:hypothetical protein
MMEDEKHEKVVFVHSACCNAHWEIVLIEDGTGAIQCEKCGKPVSQELITLHHSVKIDKCACDLCKGQQNN